MKSTLMIAVALFILFSSCQKKDDTQPDAAKVNIQINTPADGQTFRRGDTVFLDAAVAYVSELHGYDMTLTNAGNNTVVYEDQQHVHTDQFTIRKYWIDTLSQPVSVTLTLKAEIDHAGNEAVKKITIKSTL